MSSIKLVQKNQLNDLHALIINTFLDTYGKDSTTNDIDKYLDTHYNKSHLLQEINNNSCLFYFIYENDFKLAGYMKLNLDKEQTENLGPKTLEIEKIYIKSDFKRKGLGKQLINKAIQVAKDKNMKSIWLGAWENNKSALSFYNKLGFKKIGEHSFELGNEKQRDILLQKSLRNN